MRLAVMLSALVAVGCFNPDYPENLPCGANNWCPSGQVCTVARVCVSAGGDGGVAGPDARSFVDANDGLGQLLSISIGDDVTLEVGQTHQFVITGTFENGTAPLNDFARWESSDNNTMWLDFNGVAHGAAVGTATATCTIQGRVDTADVTVVPAP